ncbi:MAG: prepilin-type N-terminal cleavage/methylation domain-containing protein [Deltaproteobacteria bacterium]|nr:MAG: prepilin-type N-terminal cleavage/methylation domain-containing protein [Deltaproteobacteria bacterium]
MRRYEAQRGFSLIETLIALTLVGMAMTGLLVAFVASGQFGVLARRQATALMVARSLAGTLSRAAYTDTRLVNNNTSNDANTAFADPNGLFAQATMPGLGDPNVPDVTTITPVIVGNETFEVYVNVSPQMDPVNITVEQGRQFAVIVRYKVGSQFMRAVALGYRYNPATIGVGQLPL